MATAVVVLLVFVVAVVIIARWAKKRADGASGSEVQVPPDFNPPNYDYYL